MYGIIKVILKDESIHDFYACKLLKTINSRVSKDRWILVKASSNQR